MKVVVCDDNSVFVSQLVSKLESIFAKKGYTVEVKAYYDPMQLVHEDEGNADVYFLDIEMPEMDGIKLAQFLRKQRDSEFIFVSVHDELWRRTMKVKPIAFIRKNLLETDLEEAVEDFLKEYLRKKKNVILRDGKRPVSVTLSQVIYFSSDKDYVVLHFMNGEQKILR